MTVSSALFCISLVGVLYRAAEVTSIKVDQFPKYIKVARNTNVSMFCTFPIFQDAPDVYWRRWGEETFLEPDRRKQFNVKKGSGSFDLLNASVADSGLYYCQVKHHQKSIGDGSGCQLTVYVPPTPLKLAPVEGISATSLKLECKTTAFYPEHLEISWRRDGVENLTGIATVKNRNAEGLFEVSSSLEEAQPAQSGVVYTCLVSHVSLLVPANVSYTVNRGTDDKFALIFGCAGGAFAILLLIIILTRLTLQASDGIKRNSVEAGQSEEPVRQGPSEEIAAYATLNLRDDRGPSKRRQEKEHAVYSQTKHGTGDRLTYAAPVNDTTKNAKPRQKEESTVFAQTKQRGGDNKLTYAALQLADSKKTSKSKQQDKRAVYAEVNVRNKERS